MTYEQLIERDQIIGNIRRWNQLDHSWYQCQRLTRDAKHRARLAHAAWQHVVDTVRKSSNTAILAAAKQTSEVWQAVKQVQNEN